MKVKLKRKLALLFTTVLLCTSLAACKGSSSSEKSSSEKPKSITFGFNQFPTNMDPALEFNGWYTSRFGVGETLVKLNAEMKIEPILADSWKRVDALTWQFHIREGVKFHSGKAVTAEAAKASLERALKLNKRAGEVLLVDTISANGQELTIKTKKPHEALLGNIADPLTTIVDTTAAEDTFAKAPICTGPFKVKSYTANSTVVVEKNKDYWEDKAKLDEATFKYIKDDNTRAMALQSGEIDAATSIPSNNMSLFEDKSKYNTDKISSLRIILSYENLNNEFLKDPAVRKAISVGIDRETYGKTLLKGSAVAAVGPFPGSLPFGNKNLTGYKYDKAEAAKLLSDAGYKDTDGDGILDKNGKKLELNLAFYTTRSELPILSEAMQAQLKEIGISTKLQSYESVAKVLKSKEFDLCLLSVNTAVTGDPQSFLQTYFKTGGSENCGGYSNPEVDDLIDKLATEQNTEARYDIATKIQQKLIDDNADLFLVSPMLNIISKNTVSGLKMYPLDYYILDNKVSVK
ncbi:ABC transporter substrate-binding protein [Clostridium magnum]|uniref:Oligopeptide-binding protein AppA n=1 Tax=Clostridium magnum DSM 2767 TaxID=1121326 RepID=A0A161YMY6_9CLOT|nr:ABC transporter substrate-binding protein [Clostridium magnum]KZL92062.1 oligopeptide-binding protein AppA precursor [Clostridium magnum DSM 2767]SHH24004.1 peptide/nickel transport system substrate-binding protein [Clostridium magnum DSM 2767]